MDTINNPATLNELWNHPSNGTHSLTTALKESKKHQATIVKNQHKRSHHGIPRKTQVKPTNPTELQTVIDSINGLDPKIKNEFVDTRNLTILKTAISGKETPANNDCLSAITRFEEWLGVKAALTVDDLLFQDRHELKEGVTTKILEAMTSSSEHIKQQTLQNIATFVTKTTSPNQIKNLLTTPLSGDKDTTLLNLIITEAKSQNAHTQTILAHGLAHVSKQEQQSILADMTQWKTKEKTITYSGILKTIAEEQPKLLTAAHLNTLLNTWHSNEALILNILIPLAKRPEDGQPNDLKSIQPLLNSTAIQTLIQSLTTLDESTKNRAIQCLEFIGATLLNEGPSLRPENLTTLHTILSALSSEDITFEHVLTDPIDRFLKAHEEHFKDDDIPTKSEHNAKPPPLKRSQSSPSLSSKETTIDEVLRLAKLIKLKLSRLNTSEFERPDDPGSASPSRPRSAANPLPPPSADSTFASPPSPSSAGSPFTSPSSPPSAGSPLASQLAGLGVNTVSPDQAAAAAQAQQGEAAAVPSPPQSNQEEEPQP